MKILSIQEIKNFKHYKGRKLRHDYSNDINIFTNCTILFPTDHKKDREVLYLCQCNCGNHFTAKSSYLKQHHNISCDICKTGIKIGDIFNRLTVISELPERDHNTGEKMFLCNCSCGTNNLKISARHLKSGVSQSCGCLQKEKVKYANFKDITNQRFGKLIAISPTENKTKDGSILWNCQCDCGNTVVVNGSFLRTGKTLSYGCLKSKGEEKIAQILKNNNILFEQQKTFSNCLNPENTYPLRFDFYLPDKNILIEYDGEQHFYYSSSGRNTKKQLEKTQKYDDIKNNYCVDNMIKLLRISYKDYNKLTDDFLLKLINQ